MSQIGLRSSSRGVSLWFVAVIFLVLGISGTSCRRSRTPAYVVVHLLRDPSASFVPALRQVALDFGAQRHYVASRKLIIVGTIEGGYAGVLERFSKSPWDLAIFDSESDVPDSLLKQLGTKTPVCGGHPAFIPDAIAGEQREAAQIYLRFIVSDCK